MKIKNYIKCLPILLGFVWISNLPAQEYWESMADMPEATSWYGSCYDSISEKAYFFGGGNNPNDNLLLTATTQIYDFKTDTWSLGADMPNKASAFSAEMVNGKVYIIGEFLKPHALTTVKEYDPVNDTFIAKAQLPEIFYAHGSCVYDGLIYSFGGRDNDFNLINTVRTYDPLTDTWNELADMPYNRDKSAVCVYEDEIYLFGDTPSLKYTPADSSWTELNAGTCEIVAYAVPVIDGDCITLFGGYNGYWGGNYPNPTNEIWAYYPAADTLVKLEDEMPFNRFTRGHTDNNHVYLFGGHYNNTLGSVTNEVWRIDLNLVSINENEYVFRDHSILHQNYPNPFSGSTVINYELLEPAFISIDVYDILGKKITGLINEFQGIGKYEVEWNNKGLNSGVYFAVLSDGKTQQRIKMIISK